MSRSSICVHSIYCAPVRKSFAFVPRIFAQIFFAASLCCAQSDEVQFNRDVRPILASKCFACHGPDENHREADLRLDIRKDAIDHGAFEPGDVAASDLIDRIQSDDDDYLMPPPHFDKPLTQDEKRILQRWIETGAEYQTHWAFEQPFSHTPPEFTTPEEENWIRNPIDRFVLERLKESGLSPSVKAEKAALVRRLYLDLIGIPPTPEEADAFINSANPNAYSALVDELLNSPKYGERWARPWLDLARYADTNGYEKDRPRNIWPYRDWVIRALNEDLPYDQFTIYQLAGDMLPNPTNDQLIATGFHRNTMLNEEGGIDPLEYRYLAMVDRVATTGTVWMGLTLGCAQCHTHKFDPITHTDYYQMMALLNNADEPDFAIHDPSYLLRKAAAEAKVETYISGLIDKFPPAKDQEPTPELRSNNFKKEFERWRAAIQPLSSQWNVIRPASMKSNLPRLELQKDGSIFSTGDITKRDEFEFSFDIQTKQPIHSIRIEALPDNRLPAGGPGRTYYEGRKGDFFLSEVDGWLNSDEIEFRGASDTYNVTQPKTGPNLVLDGVGSSGWRPFDNKAQRLQLVLNLKEPITENSQLRLRLLFERHYATSLGRFRFSISSNPDAKANRLSNQVESIVSTDPENWTDDKRQKAERAFLLETPLLAEAHKELKKLQNQMPGPTETLVMQERPADHPRQTFRHHRGEYLSPKEKVAPGIPGLFDSTTTHQPGNRLELAQWLVSDSNPLAARVAVNRSWREFFGRGLVQTDGDFGVQSRLPSHPELLDWLAIEFRNSGWSMKKLHRLIVTSATYRQTSLGNESSLQLDPDNTWLSRGPRYRMTGEMFRDVALKATGLLSDKMYGPGVKPPQPGSVTALAWGNNPWKSPTNEDRYRRSIYTFIKRTAAFAAYTVFDGPTGENCVARRNRSNTPLQSLTVLNDQMFVEMTFAVAKAASQSNDECQKQISELFRRFLTRHPNDDELKTLVQYYEAQIERLRTGELTANKISGNENSSEELVALALVARVIMNLDETITK